MKSTIRNLNLSAKDVAQVDELASKVEVAYARRDREIPTDRYARTTPREICGQHEREFRMMSLLKDVGLASLKNKRVLDIGCGRGATLRLLLEYGAEPANLVGMDLLGDRIEQARHLNPQIKFLCANASNTPFANEEFDLVIQFTTFTSILDGESRKALAMEIQRVLKPAGKFLWYDFMFDNPWNADVRGIRPSEIKRLFPGYKITGTRITLAPPLGRIVARISYALYHVMAQMRPLCTHYLCVLEKSQ